MKKINIVYLLFVMAIGFYSCSSDESTENTQNLNLTKSISFSPKLNFDKPTTFKRSDVNVDSLLNNVVSELYSFDINSGTSKKEISSDKNLENYDGVDIKIGEELIEITPIYGTNPPLEGSDDNADCGGKSGDGWQKFATCRSEDCVKKETETAVKQLTNSLSSGKCRDIRIKRNTLSATVCARVVSC